MKLKKAVAIILSLVMLCTALVFTSGAESAYLESEHPYENDFYQMYTYTYPEDVDGFFVTFGEDTSFESEGWDFEPEDFNPEWTLSELYSHYKEGDVLGVYSNYVEKPCADYYDFLNSGYYHYDLERGVAYDYSGCEYFSGKELAGKTLYIEGNTLACELISDESVTDYGFTVDYVGTEIPDGAPYAHFHLGDKSYYQFFDSNNELIPSLYLELDSYYESGYVFSGWATQPDGELVYKYDSIIKYEGENLELYPVWTKDFYTVTYVVETRNYYCNFPIDEHAPDDFVTISRPLYSNNIEPQMVLGWSESENSATAEYATNGAPLEWGRNYVLYPVWRETSFDMSEMFSFDHSSNNFPNNYAVNDMHYERMMKSAALTFGINPLSYPLGVASLIFHKTFNESDGWGGSCCGMAITAALQHEGYIDILSEQNASCVRDLEPTEELISTINYYQAFNIESSLAENQALNFGTPVYKQNIKDLYESAASGKIPMITYFYAGDSLGDVASDLLSGNGISAHTVLAVGAFELDEPVEGYSRAIIIYNCNNQYGYELMYVADDWSSLYYSDFYDGTLGSFKWTDDYSQFKSFDISGDVNPTSWHIAVIMRIIRFFKIVMEALQFIF